MAEGKDPMIDPDDRSARELRDDIRRTRAQMDATVDAIEEKLTPGELIHEVWGLFRGGSSSSVNRILKVAKQHPMPVAIIGLGVGWMVYENVGGTTLSRGRVRYTARYPDESSYDDQLPTALDSARRRAAGVTRRASDAAGSAIDRAGDLADDAAELASDAAGSVRRATEATVDKAGELAGQAREGVRQARAGFWETLEEQPLIVGAATLAAGLLVGLLVPSTPQEDELMGETRDSLLEEVKGFGQEALEKGKQSVDAVADQVRAVGRDVAETVKAEAEKTPQPPTHRAA